MAWREKGINPAVIIKFECPGALLSSGSHPVCSIILYPDKIQASSIPSHILPPCVKKKSHYYVGQGWPLSPGDQHSVPQHSDPLSAWSTNSQVSCTFFLTKWTHGTFQNFLPALCKLGSRMKSSVNVIYFNIRQEDEAIYSITGK